jgi:hypothetical protein
MKDRKLATRYAKALLAALPDPSEQDLTGAFLTALATSVESNPDLNAFFLDPGSPSAAKKTLLVQLAETRGLPERGQVVPHSLGGQPETHRSAVHRAGVPSRAGSRPGAGERHPDVGDTFLPPSWQPGR